MDRLVAELLRIVSKPETVDELQGVLGAFCHQWRNHLNVIKLGLHLAKQARDESQDKFWADMDGRYHSLEKFILDLQEICRPMRIMPMRLPLHAFWSDRERQWQTHLESLGRTFLLDPPSEPVHVDFDLIRFSNVFDSLIEGRAGPGPIQIRWWEVSGAFVHVEWHEPEALLHARSTNDRPASLALPVLGRLLASHGGSLDIQVPGERGFLLAMSWPSAFSNMRGSP